MKTRKFKFLFALVTSMVMLLTLCIPAFGADPTYTITILPNSADKASHTYEAYQIFKGDLDEGTLANIEWGSGIVESKTVDDKTVYQALAAQDDVFANADTAAEIADGLASAELDADKIPSIAKVLAAYLSATHTDSQSSGSDIIIKNLPAGYYLVKDADAALNDDEAAYTNYLLRLVRNVSVSVKSEIPSLDKNITDGSSDATKAASYSIGDDVPFTLTSAVPDMSGYNCYYFIFTDTMTEGLTFNDDVAVEILKADGTVLKKLEEDTDFTVEKDAENNQFQLIFKNFIQYNTEEYIGNAIVATYTARLNEDAEIGGDPLNKNTAQLLFSNNPNYDYDPTTDVPTEADPGTPGSGDPTYNEPIGKTPKIENFIYTTGLKIVKVDAETLNRLNGAEFTIEGEGIKDVIKISCTFTEDTNGSYYQLLDGSYTEEAPTDATKANYVSTTTLYKMTQNILKATDTGYVAGVGMVGDDGIVSFVGLNTGKYTITESQTPYGYNTIGSFQIEITAQPIATGCTWDAQIVDDGGMMIDSLQQDSDELFSVIVKNSKGALLPSTGGIGTTLFYIIGSVLVLGAIILMVTRKRMNTKEK